MHNELRYYKREGVTSKGEKPCQKIFRYPCLKFVGAPLCVASNDGQKVYDRIAAALKADQHVALSFHEVTTLTDAFLNAAVGQLYGTFSERTNSVPG